jgi:3-oxoacyl-[acyl-carrier-protein] synthase II
VVVTGLGLTTPLGGDVAGTWAALLAGRSGARSLDGPDYAALPVRIGAPLATDPDEQLSRIERRRWDRVQQLAVVAARQAWADAGFAGTAAVAGLDPDRLGAVVGTGIGGITTTLDRYEDYRRRGWSALTPFTVTMTMPNGAAATVSQQFDARAGTHAPVSACATGAEALTLAVRLIRSGRADVVLAGGAESALHPFTIAGFAAMRALSRRNDDPAGASRPFDADRDGFVLGDGAGMLVLESTRHAAARGATVYAELAGIGITSDPEHAVKSDPEGVSARQAMRLALADAAADPAEVAHVNAHATATPAGDLAEATAIQALLGPDVPVTATKSMTGHLLGAAGAVEAAITVLSLREGVVPPTINCARLDPGAKLRVVTGSPERLAAAPGRRLLALSNSFGFGGHNVTLALRSAS